MNYSLLFIICSAILANGYYLGFVQRYCDSPAKADTIKCIAERKDKIIDIYQHCIAIIKSDVKEVEEELEKLLCNEFRHEQLVYFDVCFNGALKLHDGRGNNMSATTDHCLKKHNPDGWNSRRYIHSSVVRINKYYT